MLTKARLALGTVVKRGDGGTPEIFTRVGECISLPEIGEESPLVKVTPSDATAEEYIAGIPDGMELDFQFNFDPTDQQQVALIVDCKRKVNRNFQVTVPAVTTIALVFTLTCLKWGLQPTPDKQIILTFKGKVSGGVALAGGVVIAA